MEELFTLLVFLVVAYVGAFALLEEGLLFEVALRFSNFLFICVFFALSVSFWRDDFILQGQMEMSWFLVNVGRVYVFFLCVIYLSLVKL